MNRTARLLLLFLFLLSGGGASASHLMGGEITWLCQGNGSYIFQMKVYRDCNGVPFNFTGVVIRVHNHPSVTEIPVSLFSQTDISPQCNGVGPTINCQNPADGAVQEFILRSSPINLPGIPPPQGWAFTFTGCCRNLAITNLDITGLTGFTLRAIMYPYAGSNTSPCYDSSPVFAERPTTVLCTGTPFTYNHNAYDVDKDSLVYSFAQPLDSMYEGSVFSSASYPAAIPWEDAFNVNSPFPGPELSGSVPASLNTSTGEISFTPNENGNYVTAVKVSAYRCGTLVAEIFREIQTVVIPCGINLPPIITAPFVNTQTGLQTSFTDTVNAGDMVSFTITATDNEFLPIGTAQSISVNASGGQFGTNFNNPNAGCTDPPCATLDPAPPVILPNNGTITFNWQTGCDHVANNDNCFTPINIHTFVLTFKDDYCPAPSYRIATISVVIVAPELVPSPSLRCLAVAANGDVELTWMPSVDPIGYFNSYQIFSGPSANGPFTVIDSIFDISQNSYTNTATNANNASVYYYIRSRSGCGGNVMAAAADTLQTIFLEATDAGSGQIEINWNALSQPLLPTTILPYRVLRQYPPAAMLDFTTTPALTTEDFMSGCLQDIFYNVTIEDQSGCTSVSNVNGGPFSNDQPPNPPSIDSVSVNYTDNSVYIGWTLSASADTRAYIIYQIINGVPSLVDTVFDQTATSYLFQGGNPDAGPLSFIVTALDECDLESSDPPDHSTIHLDYELFSCENRVTLSWNPYDSWAGGVNQYDVYVSENGAVYEAAGTSPNNFINLSNLEQSAAYCFIVRGISSQGNASSTSNEICFFADVQDLPEFAYLRKATVLSDGSAFSTCVIDTASDAAFYKVLRSPFPGNTFDTLVTAAIPLATNEVSYTDVQALTGSQSYTYVYVLVDKCNNESKISNNGRTILLQGIADDGFVNRIRWNTYGNWDAGVNQYRLYRSMNGGATFAYLATTASDTTFVDRVFDEVDTSLVFCYIVEAIENTGNQYGFQDTSWSNKLCVTQKPTVYIPNTFIPRSNTNNTFKAVGLYENLATNHEFIIFNRWGEEIFYTKDTHESWDGKYMSAYVPGGIYVYRIRFNYPDGSSFDHKGAVLVLD